VGSGLVLVVGIGCRKLGPAEIEYRNQYTQQSIATSHASTTSSAVDTLLKLRLLEKYTGEESCAPALCVVLEATKNSVPGGRLGTLGPRGIGRGL
jgi:hypothetical protein